MASTTASSHYFNDGPSGCCTSSPSDEKCNVGRFSYKRPNDANADVDAQIAKDLNSLSVKDREKLYEDVNGIPETVEEDPDHVEACLAAVDKELDFVTLDRSAYDLAMERKPQLLKDREFRLMFLRAESFDVRKAARRIVKHFASKQLLFGADKLVKRITYEDLSENVLNFLLSGAFRILRNKDQGGRTVLFAIRKLLLQGTNSDVMDYYRMFWYLLMSAVQDDETVQKKGFTSVSYHNGCRQLNSLAAEGFRKMSIVIDAVPFRVLAAHFCYDNPNLRPLAGIIQNVVNRDHRLRFRAHYGSDMECQYKLIRFGIPQRILPIDSAGQLKQEEFLAEIEGRKKKERQYGKVAQSQQVEVQPVVVQVMENPSGPNNNIKNKKQQQQLKQQNIILESEIKDNDVLLGRGFRRLHQGNIELSNVIKLKTNAYLAASKFEKTCIAMSIVDKVKESNGRFLDRCSKDRKESSGWIEVSDVKARMAVIFRFRNKVPNPPSYNPIDFLGGYTNPTGDSMHMSMYSEIKKRAKILQ